MPIRGLYVVAAVVHVGRHLLLHLRQHLERRTATERLDGLFSVHVVFGLQKAFSLDALLHSLCVLAVHEFVFHMDEQLQNGHRPLALLGVGVGVLVDVVVRDIVRDAVDQRDLSVLAAGSNQLVHHATGHLDIQMLGVVGAHGTDLGINGYTQALFNE